MRKLIDILHLRGIKRKRVFYLVNNKYAGKFTKRAFDKKRKLLNSIGIVIGEGTRVVGPIECWGKLIVGKNCWIGKNLKVNGNGMVVIGDNCDIAPEVTFQTGGHKIGSSERRAGEGVVHNQKIGNGVWVGGRVTICNTVSIGDSSVVASCACVVKDVPPNVLVGGVPAKVIRELEE